MDDLALALHLADVADTHLKAASVQTGVSYSLKEDGSAVSTVDLAVENDLRDILGQQRPDDTVIGEEAPVSSGSSRAWVIDPVDHTNNFVRGVPVFGTLIALMASGAVEVGVVSSPPLHRRWWAQRGQGAYTDDGRPIHVSSVGSLADAYLSFAALHLWEQRGHLPGLVQLSRHCRHGFGSGGFWAHMLVAEGLIDVSLDPWGKIWDLAPIQVILEEAGGRFTDLNGDARPDRGSAVVSNGLLHDAVLSTLTAGASS